MRALAETQRRHYEEFVAFRAETDRRFAELAEAQRATQEEVRALAETQRRHYEEFAAFRAETDRRFAELAEAVKALTQDVGVLKDHDLVRRYRERGSAYFGGRRFRRVRALTTEELMARLEEALDAGQISSEEYEEAREIDLVFQGQWEGRPLWLVLEISWAVDPRDIERATKRAWILGKILGETRPGVAGARLTRQAEEAIAEARKEGVPLVVVRDGRVDWPA